MAVKSANQIVKEIGEAAERMKRVRDATQAKRDIANQTEPEPNPRQVEIERGPSFVGK